MSKHAKTHNFSVVFLWIIRYACWWFVVCRRIDQRRRSGNWRDEEKIQVSLCPACLNPAVWRQSVRHCHPYECKQDVWIQYRTCHILKPKLWCWRHVGLLLLRKIRKFPVSDIFLGNESVIGQFFVAQHMQYFFTRWNWIFDDKILPTFILIRVWILCVPPGLTFNNSAFCPHSVFVCFVWISEQTAIISVYSINLLIFKT